MSRIRFSCAVLAAITFTDLAFAQDPQPEAPQPPPKPRPAAAPKAKAPDEEAPKPALEAPAPGEHRVLAVEDGLVVLDITSESGAKVGDVVELWRPIRVRHPVSGDLIEDRVLIGKLELTQVRDKLSLAKPLGELGEALVPGDLVVLGEGQAYQHEEIEPPHDGAEVPASGADATAVNAMMIILRGASLRRRIATYEAFVKRYPESAYTATLWEEAQALRELIRMRSATIGTDGPTRPEGAISIVDSGSDDTSSVDFGDLELQRARNTSVPLPPAAAPQADATAPAKPPGYHLHDGFFLRLSFGPQYFNGAYEGGFRQDANYPQVPAEADLDGIGFTSEVVIGGAPTPGLVLAGRLAMTFAPSPTLELSELGTGFTDADLDAIIMPFTGGLIDIYPDPELGIHFFATVGFTGMSLEGDDRVGVKEFYGVGYGGGIGFEGFIADEWSMGVNLRIDGAYMGGGSASSEDDNVHMVLPAVQVAATFN
jgi:hypothetical protein